MTLGPFGHHFRPSQTLGWQPKFAFSLRVPREMCLSYASLALKFPFSLRVPSETCFSDTSSALKICILAAGPKGNVLFLSYAGTQNSYFRCGSQGHCVFPMLHWNSKFAFSLRVPREICFSDASLALKICILAAGPKGNVLFRRFAGNQIRIFAAGPKGFFAVPRLRWHSKFAFSLRVPRVFCSVMIW